MRRVAMFRSEHKPRFSANATTSRPGLSSGLDLEENTVGLTGGLLSRKH